MAGEINVTQLTSRSYTEATSTWADVNVYPELHPRQFDTRYFTSQTVAASSGRITPIVQSSNIAAASYWPIKASWCANADKLEGATKAQIISAAVASAGNSTPPNVSVASYCQSSTASGGTGPADGAGIVKTMCAQQLMNVWASYRNNADFGQQSCADCSYIVPTAAAVVGLLYTVLTSRGVWPYGS